MREILVVGAGHSAPFLIHDLLEHAEGLDARVTVADLDGASAQARVGDHPRGRGIAFDIHDEEARRRRFAAADIVVHLLPPPFQAMMARQCLALGTHMVSASYKSNELRELEGDAERRGVLLLCELGLDPGIDVMSAQEMIHRIHAAGGVIDRFYSYGGGLPDPEAEVNPLRYCITWNPRNVVMAAHDGAEYLQDGRVRLVPWHRVFRTYWTVNVPGIGEMEAYPNRDSLRYQSIHQLDGIQTLVRATLRYPGYCDFWHEMVRLGLPNEALEIPDLEQRTYRELVEMILPPWIGSTSMDTKSRLAELLELDPEGELMGKFQWLGLLSEEKVGGRTGRKLSTPADALVQLLERKLPLPPTERDLVVLHHELEVRYPEEGGRRERVRSTFRCFGEPGGFTAMARGVGQPASLAVRRILEGKIRVAGARVPILPEIYEPILAGLAEVGMGFEEEVTALPDH